MSEELVAVELTCPVCGATSTPGQRFCGQCGAALAVVCATCGTANDASFRFCGSCGAPLATAAAGATTATSAGAATATAGAGPATRPAAGRSASAANGAPASASVGAPAGMAAEASPAGPPREMRLVSVLFCDLVGYTTLSENRDAEDVRELLSTYFDTARTLVQRYGGVVEKFIGDAVMAVWGSPVAMEDDAERAVRAGLELVAAVSELGDDVRAPGLRARVGVSTGRVASGTAEGEALVVGDRVNTASRIQTAADSGTVFVDDATRQAAGTALGFADAGEHTLKGKAEPVHLWRATRVLSSVGGVDRVDGLEAAFAGRDHELGLVKELLHACIDQGRARLVAVSGVAGVGKSRLGVEFSRYVDGVASRMYWHEGRCLSYGEGVAFWALAEMVRQRFGVAETDSDDVAAERLDAGLTEWVPDTADRVFLRPRLGQLLGLGQPGLSRDELFAGWRLFFERLAEAQPVILMFEDFQWADDGLLDFVDYLLDWSADHPVFVLTLARPELVERRPTRRAATSVYLDPIDEATSRALLDDLVPGLPTAVADQVVAQAEGIPLYLVETVRGLVDRDIVVPRDGVYRLVGEVGELAVPASLTALIGARLDALPPTERALVKSLSVLSGSFPRTAAAAVSALDDARLDDALAALVRKELLSVRAEKLSPDRGQYTFTQTLLRQVAYDTLSRRERKALHLAAAAHLRAAFPDDGADVVEAIANHYADALAAGPADPDAADIQAEAATAFAKAANRAGDLGAPSTASGLFRRAASLSADPARAARLTRSAAEAAHTSADYVRALELYDDAAERYAAAGDQRSAVVTRGLGALPMTNLGSNEQAAARYREALDELGTAVPDSDVAQLASGLGRALFFYGRGVEAAPWVETGLAMAQALGDPEQLGSALGVRGFLLASANRYDEAEMYLAAAAAVFDDAGLLHLAAQAHSNLADIRKNRDRPGAVEHLLLALGAGERLGNSQVQGVAVANLAYCELMAGHMAELERLLGREPPAGGSGVRTGWAYLRGYGAELAALRGDLPSAHAALSGMRDTMAGSDDEQDRAMLCVCEMAVALADGDLDGALHWARYGPAAIRALGWSHETVRLGWPDAMEAAIGCGRLDVAEALLRLLARQPRGHVPPYLHAQHDRFAARLAGLSGDATAADRGFAAATRQLRDLGYPYWHARTLLDHAEYLAGAGRPAEAAPPATEALELFTSLGVAPMIPRAQVLARIGEGAASPAGGLVRVHPS
ncbi:MAG TPA: adenylate/guanylate cyclase domain-containing protein [Nocardioidaceae bacterium]|nr:adenylate/guanylate cyclase domain-containing protein [Nocardioidaceae bacterium]